MHKIKWFYNLQIFIICLFAAARLSAQQSGNESQVTKYNYPEGLKAQQKVLETDPFILRFKKSREAYKTDRYRPIYHFVSPENRLNDPNGLSYWKGNWHLFYQGYPPEDPRQHWGHAVSTDLIHWTDLPYAIYPDPEKACFSGSVWVEEDRAVAMYHGTTVGNMIAIATDPLLLNWEKLENKAVIPLESTTGFPLPYTVFDPFLWKKDSIYYSLSGSGLPNGPEGKPIRAHFLFRSKDLINWEYMHEFVEGDRFTMVGDDGACPYFWPIGDKHILLFFSHNSGGQYLLGDYDTVRNKFVATSHGKFNFGASRPSGVHAPSAFPDWKGGIIVIFNMNKGKDLKGWDQMMSLPRRLTLLSKDELGIEPAGDIESLRYNVQHLSSVRLPENEEIVLSKIKGNAMELVAEIDMKDSKIVELNVLRSPKKEEFTRIIFYKEKGYYKGLEYKEGTEEAEKFKRRRYSSISLETSYSSTLPDVNFRPPETAPVLLAPEEKLKLRVFIDKSIVEVFVNGKQCVAARVFPGRDDSIGISFRSQGNESEIISLDAYQMKNIYEE